MEETTTSSIIIVYLIIFIPLPRETYVSLRGRGGSRVNFRWSVKNETKTGRFISPVLKLCAAVVVFISKFNPVTFRGHLSPKRHTSVPETARESPRWIFIEDVFPHVRCGVFYWNKFNCIYQKSEGRHLVRG